MNDLFRGHVVPENELVLPIEDKKLIEKQIAQVVYLKMVG